MCTQTLQAENKGRYRSSHVSGHNRHRVGKRTSRSKTRRRTGPSLLNSQTENSSQLYWESCNSLTKEIEVKCLLAGPLKCKHIICLLFACLAVSVSADIASTGHSNDSTSPASDIVGQENFTQPDNFSLLDSTNISIPLSETQQDNASTVFPPESSLKNTAVVVPILIPTGHSGHSHIDEHKQDSLSSNISNYGKTEGTDKEESLYFTLKMFHRYSCNNYLLKIDFETLLINIGLIRDVPLNSSHNAETEVSRSQDSHHSHSDSRDVHRVDDHLHEDINANEFHEHSSHHHHHPCNSTTAVTDSHTAADPHHEQHGTESNQNSAVRTSVPSFGSRRKREASHKHEEHNTCLSTKELLRLFGYDKLDRLNADHFLSLCPALIDQLDGEYCRHEADLHDHGHGADHEADTPEQNSTNELVTVWVYALLSVAVISLCSVAGVVVIPNMKRVFYNHILQFLVALAVGAMSGDAMLHLFPHALLSESHDANHHSHPVDHHHDEAGDSHLSDNHHHSHSHGEVHGQTHGHMDGLYKGLVALMGIYSFFFLERLFTLFTRNRSGKSEKRQKKRRRQCLERHEPRNPAFHMVNSRLENEGGNAPSCDEMVMVVHPNKALRAYADVSHDVYLHHCDESLVQSPSDHGPTTVPANRDQHVKVDDSLTIEGVNNVGLASWSADGDQTNAEIAGITKNMEPIETLHSHSHSHLAPEFVGPLSSVAMMVIVGDMIHNFCDGLAIGAAYAGSVGGGLSTSVAVFCHELPHEIGDFAVLVRSGLTMKKAVYFNLISSIPSFIGAIIGLVIGNVTATSSWIFAGVGGMFLYVTLVDLIPEMSSVYTKCGEPWFLHLLLQASGIAVGTTIMLVISVYEESLLTSFK